VDSVACETCGLVQRLPQLAPGLIAECVRCGARLAHGHDGSLTRTAAFSLAALMFYLPANLYPILRLEWYGVHSEKTALDGAIALFREGQPVIATIVFLASIAVPFLKLVTLFYLVATVSCGRPRGGASGSGSSERSSSSARGRCSTCS